MKTKEEIQDKLTLIRETLKRLYNELDTITDKEKHKTLFQEILVHLTKEKTLVWVLSKK